MQPEHQLLLTKLFKPHAQEAWVARPRLLQQLDFGLHRRLILVDAPPGYGKTTLLAQWLSMQAIPSAWLSLDEDDNDPGVFLAYVARAIRAIYPESMQSTAMVLSAAELPPVDDLARTLINEIHALPESIILVLDDFHAIQSDAIDKIITRLVEHLPPALHLVLTSRNDPHLPLAKLRARGDIFEIRAADLKFTTAEAREFMRIELQESLDERTAQVLESKTEGWPAGLRLVTLSMRAAADRHAFVRSFDSAGSTHVMSFFVQEVLENLSMPTQDFLLRTSVLDRFCAPLCAELRDVDKQAGEKGVTADLLADVGRRNLFLIPLDEDGEWFRFHHLFRDLLRKQLRARTSDAFVSSLHARASDWLAAHGFQEEALQHARAAGDMGRIVRIIESNVLDVLNREEWMTLARWLKFVPPDVIQCRPRMLLAYAYMKFLRNEWMEILPLVEQAARLLDDDESGLTAREKDAMLGEMNVLRAHIYIGDGDKGIEWTESALESLPADHIYTRGIAITLLALIMQSAGLNQEAEARLQRSAARATTSDAFSIRVLFSQVALKWLAGEIGLAAELTGRYLAAAEASELIVSICWANAFAGVRDHELNDLERAIEHFDVVAEHLYQSNHLCVIVAYSLRLHACHAVGRPDLVNAALGDLRTHAQTMQSMVNWRLMQSLEARLRFLRGDMDGAMHWVRTTAPRLVMADLLTPELPNLTRAQILIAQRSADMLEEALALLHELRGAVEARHYHYLRLKVLAVQASGLWAIGRREEALQSMAVAAEIGQRGGLIRALADLGSDVLTVVQAFAGGTAHSSQQRDYLARVVAAFGGATVIQAPVASASLTARECEVLTLVGRNRSDKEIAEALVLSRLTVSKHTANIYRKLGVSNRREAVAKARSLGILA